MTGTRTSRSVATQPTCEAIALKGKGFSERYFSLMGCRSTQKEWSGLFELIGYAVVGELNHLHLEVHADMNLFVSHLFAQSSKHL